MSNYNKVMLMGRLTRDPELRYTPSGTAVAEFGLAVNRYFKGQDGERKEAVTFVDITVWARTAELCAEYLGKGRQAFIEGRLELDQWENKEGQKRSKLKVVGETVQFIGGPPRQGGSSEGGSGAGQSRQEAPAQEKFEVNEDEIPF